MVRVESDSNHLEDEAAVSRTDLDAVTNLYLEVLRDVPVDDDLILGTSDSTTTTLVIRNPDLVCQAFIGAVPDRGDHRLLTLDIHMEHHSVKHQSRLTYVETRASLAPAITDRITEAVGLGG